MILRLLGLFIVMGMMCMSDAEAKDEKKMTPEKAPAQEFSQTPIITKGTVTIKGKSIPYTATTGFMNITDDNGAVKATMFYVAYVRSDMPSEKRPITYAFNGGPGSSSVWLHMGALGPKRVVLTDKGDMPKPPGNMVDNEYSWLEFTDLVFIDPVGTGYSRPAKDEKKEQFHGLDEDVTSVGTFIRLYTTQNKRWLSPKFLAGESYGTTRAAYLSDHLADRHGMYVNGILLISMVLDFQTLRFSPANDLPCALFLPTYAATAMYHGKLDESLRANQEKSLEEIRSWALNDYLTYLAKGHVASDAEHKAVTEKLSRYTGLSKEFIATTHNRPDIFRFTKELLRDEGKTVGRLDSRFTGIDRDNAGENFEYDPSYNAVIYAPFTSTVNHYLRSTLGFESDLPYEILTGKVQPWNWGSAERGFPYVGEALRKAMTKNKFLKVYVANGWYDLATPFFAAEYTMNHMPLESSLRNNISMKYYKSGHMMYIEKESLKQFTKDVEQFYGNTLAE
ncbi:MAG: S10 family peptidase [Candidatus Kapaibacteriota bacterium]